MTSPVLQVLMGLAGSFGFSVLFNVRGWRLVFASLGGALSWTLYLLAEPAYPSEMFRYFLSASFVAVYAEILARVMKTPATTFLIPSIIPHIPGGALYHTMRYALNREWGACLSQAVYTLSLALGLRDVIQAASGGIRVDAMFVDEGFGALDSESLDQSCETLQSLVEPGQMIGIISHVQELRERIDRQIVVDKTNQGSRIRINA